ncbi:MAG: cytochrome b5 domain-containing protein [Acholeplasmataceae bacterium]
MRKLFYVCFFGLVLILSACQTNTLDESINTNDPDVTEDQQTLLELTLEELAAFDGRSGRKAYIAVNGNIYDVTNSPRWPNGSHNGYQAGQDLTEEILNVSPHGLRTLDGVPLIGILVDNHQEGGTE